MSILIRKTALAALLLCAQVAAAQTAAELAASRYDIDPQHSSVAFTSKLLGLVKVRGRFTRYAGTIIYDPAHPERSSVTAIIDAASINTDMSFRDNHLRSPDFFDTKTYPTIVFQSDRVERSGSNLRATGRFTMHGVTRTISFPITVVLKPNSPGPSKTVSVAFETALPINRNDFGIAATNKFNPSYDPVTSALADRVDINLELSAQRAGYFNSSFAGRTPPSIADTVSRTLAANGVDSAVHLYRSLRANNSAAYNVSAGQLDALGRQLLQHGKTSDAVAILTLNQEFYPTAAGVSESLGEAYAWAGDGLHAITAYRRELQVDSTNTPAIEMLRHLVPAARPGGGK